MRTKTNLSLLFLVLNLSLHGQNLFINEFLASNDTTIADEFGEFDDWVEIYNAGDTAIDIGGYYLTDDLSEPDQWQLPTTSPDSTTIPPNGFLLLWFDKDTDQGMLHVNAKLGASGEQIGLYQTDLTIVDTITFEEQTTDISFGRTEDGSDSWSFFTVPTPNAMNINTPVVQADPPVFSLQGGFYDTNEELTLSATDTAVAIYYTTDGSTPDTTDLVYSGPIMIDSTMIIRAIAGGSGYLNSPTATESFFYNLEHQFPIVSVNFEPQDFFDSTSGIYVNYMENWERPVNVEYYEPDGTRGFNSYGSAEIHGSASAIFPHKSIALKAKNSHGSNAQFPYPIFDNLPYESYGSIILRNSGQDWDKTLFRDAMGNSLVLDLDDLDSIIEPPMIYGQAYQPAVVYYNGQYWGIHNIRERLDKRYIKTHYDLDEGEYDFIKGVDEAKYGDLDKWMEFMNFLLASDMSDQADFDSLKTWMDTKHYMDYVIFNVYLNNMDWPGNNNRRFREKSPDGKWHWLTYDLDFTFSLMDADGSWNTGNFDDNAIERLYQDTGWAWPNPEWATRPFRKCVENDDWRKQFINRAADQLNVLFDVNRILNRIDEFQANYSPEIPKHADKWWDSYYGGWEPDIDTVRQFVYGRTDAVRGHFVDVYDEIVDTAAFTIQAEPAEGGAIQLNTVHLKSSKLPWSGVYFDGVEVPITAIPDAGYHFVGWSEASLGLSPSVEVDPGLYPNLTAYFALDTVVQTSTPKHFTEVTLFPNPAQEVINIDVNRFSSSSVHITIYNTVGELIWQNLSSSTDYVQVNTSNFPKGQYICQLTTDEQTGFARFAIQ